MTLVVEDGTGLTNADSYLSVADADTYFTNLGNTSWAGTTTVKEVALRKATQYLDNTYNWIGDILSLEQSLNWPRTDVEDSNGRDLSDSVPVKVKNATAEMALLTLSSTLVPNTTNANYVKREKVGELETEYFSGAPTGTQYRYVDRMLNGLYDSKSGPSSTRKLSRV